MKIFRTLFIAALVVSGGVLASGDDADLDEILRNPTIGNYKGYAEFKMARYDSARRIWEALDRAGFGEAAFNLGVLYEDGLGVDANIERALSYYRRGAENGSVKAQFRIGKLFWLGAPGILPDHEEGRRYLAMAAANGDSDAAAYLADGPEPRGPLAEADRALATGEPKRAAEILAAAALDGNVRAQTRLAWCYEAGRGVDRDLSMAVQWFERAAQAGDPEAMYALSVMHATGAGREKDDELARQWLERSAAGGFAPAVAELIR
ncbi:MAG: sel1 repeat family protein [Zoogloeaceae bacterium]|nr:sel1 repeat family protein [Rhodocyclaceae bacterium]MCP5236406.1 sel1 repeat family protein [Zoogloeaceae bacterium]